MVAQALLSVMFLLVLGVVWIWDSVCIVRQVPQYTVSAMIFQWSTAWPIVPFLSGVIIGHLFWPQR